MKKLILIGTPVRIQESGDRMDKSLLNAFMGKLKVYNSDFNSYLIGS